MQRMILILTALLSLTDLCGQTTDYTFSGEYNQLAFDSFVESLEEGSALTFFYHPEWTSGVTITAMGEELSLLEVLEQNLKAQGLSAYLYGGSNVFILRNSIMTLLHHPGSTIPDISRLLTDSQFRSTKIRCINDPVLRAFWENEFGKYQTKFQQEAVSPILNKVGQFAANPIIRNIIGQGRDRVRVERIMENKKILIAHLCKGQIGEDAASLLGAALLVKFQMDFDGFHNLKPDGMHHAQRCHRLLKNHGNIAASNLS